MMTNGDLFLGVDGGGTGCRVRLVDAAGRRLGEGEAGPANIRLGLEASWRQIMLATGLALGSVGLDGDALPRLHVGLGLAGITGPADAARVAVETDAHTACLGAFAGQDGAILILGTGSIGYALIGGQPRSVGGWGFEISDDGSGAQLGREAVRAAVRAYDELVAPSDFTDAVMARLGGHPREVVAWVNDAKPADYGRLAPLVLDHARRNDPVAVALVREAAGHVANLVRRLAALGAGRVAPMGGLAPALEDWLDDGTRRMLVAAEGDAVDGALLLARRTIGRG